MNSFYFEEKKNEFLQLSAKQKSIRLLLFKLCDFYKELLDNGSEDFIEIYTSETIAELLSLLNSYSVYGLAPEKSRNLIKIVDKLIKYIVDKRQYLLIEQNLSRLNQEIIELEHALNGASINSQVSNKLTFPALEKMSEGDLPAGIIAEVQISINSNKKGSNVEFIVMPSLPNLDSRLDEQISKSWNYAGKYLNDRYNKYEDNLHVTIKFNNGGGIYEGDSLGVTLTIGFIQELFKYYDLREELDFEYQISATGSMSENGEIGLVGNDIIEVKTETVFYSAIEKFLVPQDDYSKADKELRELLKKYPKRKLEIIPILNISDALFRREIISIEKQNIINWGSKKVLRNKVALTFMSLLFIVIFVSYYINFDNNPYQISYTSSSYLIENQSGKLLWDYPTNKNLDIYSKELLSLDHMVIDYDNDGINEVLLNDSDTHSLKLFSNSKEEIWNFRFKYNGLRTNEELFSDNYSSMRLVGLDLSSEPTTIIGFAQQLPFYPTALFKLDLTTGERLGNILWHSGGIIYGDIDDFDEDGVDEVICTAINNGLKRAVLFSIEVDKLNGRSPSDKAHRFEEFDLAEFDQYILLPTPDYFEYDFPNYFIPTSFMIDNANHILKTAIVKRGVFKDDGVKVGIEFNREFYPINILIYDKYITERDKLVKKGILDHPFSNRDEYIDSLRNQMKYWDGKRFNNFNKFTK